MYFDLEEDFELIALIMIFFVFIGFLIGVAITREIEIQEIKPVDNGYYITIDDEIYYKEV